MARSDIGPPPQEKARRRRLGTLGLAVALVGLVVAAGAVSVYMWRELGGTVISTHGTIALILGVGFTFLIGGGLIYLVMVSDRRGFDERAGRD